MYQFFPEEQRVLALPLEKVENKTKSGIILPTTVQEDKPLIAEVIEVGKGDRDRPMRYKKGDIILCSTFAGIDVHLDLYPKGLHTYKVMNQLDIMGVLMEA